jgi:hypothetical protein
MTAYEQDKPDANIHCKKEAQPGQLISEQNEQLNDQLLPKKRPVNMEDA